MLLPTLHSQLRDEAKFAGAARYSHVDALAREQIAELSNILNRCLELLDLMGLPQAAAHLCGAIEALPGQSAVLPLVPEDWLNQGI